MNREDAARAIALIEDGRSLRYVARVINVNLSTIQRKEPIKGSGKLVLIAEGLFQDEKGHNNQGSIFEASNFA